MKRTGHFLLLGLLLTAFLHQPLWAKVEKTEAVGAVFYILQATSEKPALNMPVFPQTVSVSMLERIVSNAEELQKRLERVYKYKNFTLLKAQKELFLFSENARIVSALDVTEPNLQIRLEVNAPEGDQVPVLLKVRENAKPLSSVSYLAGWSKTVITGFPFPSAGDGKKSALFIAATYWKRDIYSAKDYPKVIDFFKSLNRFVQPVPGDVNTIRAINHFFALHYHVTKTIPLTKILPSEILKQKGKQAEGAPIFQPYDVAPRPVGGFAGIQKNLVYPEKERKNNIEGTVVVNVLVGKDGRVHGTKILKSAGAALDSAAVRAIRKTKWHPALYKKGGKEIPVTVWVSLPVVFRLRK